MVKRLAVPRASMPVAVVLGKSGRAVATFDTKLGEVECLALRASRTASHAPCCVETSVVTNYRLSADQSSHEFW